MFFICKHCHEKFEGNKGETNRIFCSAQCFKEFKKFEAKQSCPHNLGVICSDHYSCFKCGWNPAVEQRRKEVMV